MYCNRFLLWLLILVVILRYVLIIICTREESRNGSKKMTKKIRKQKSYEKTRFITRSNFVPNCNLHLYRPVCGTEA